MFILAFLYFILCGQFQNPLIIQIIRFLYVIISLITAFIIKMGFHDNYKKTLKDFYIQLKNSLFIGGFLVYMLIFLMIIFNETNVSFFEAIFYIYSNFVMVACYEERLIRGLYFNELRKNISSIKAIILCGIIFLFLHIPQHIFLYQMTFVEHLSMFLTGALKGIVLGIIRLWTNNVFITAICHFNTGYIGDV